MPLSWNEIKDRALRFSREWAHETSEDAEAKSFWDGFFDVFGVSRRRVANFERKVKKLDGRDGYIDLLWKGVLLIEHKSRGKDLDRAHQQARDYFHGLSDAELPKYLLVSDFARFRLYDLDGDAEPVEFGIAELHKQVRRFGFVAGYQARSFKEEDPVNVLAAERMGKLHDALKAAGYDGHALELLLVRLLFCLFADDTGIFARHSFHELIAQRSSVDGADLGAWLGQLFQVLNTAPTKRQTTLDAQLAEFPYVNGRLFAEPLPLAAFDARMRELLIDASILDWSRISPAIFGSMFQSVMDAKARRNLGAHYTSEKNILKLIGPLFLDDLKAELARIGNHEGKLKSFHIKLANLRFLDPACGCGNFLVIAYRELRLLELELLERLYARQGSVFSGISEHVAIDVDQFYGIEIEEFPAQIAQVALWLMDHQMNLRVAERFGEYFARLPLVKSPTIVHGNALRIDWNAVVPRERLGFILGNPPFVGAKMMSPAQRDDLLAVAGNLKGAGLLDFVSAWYLKAAQYMPASAEPSPGPPGHPLPRGEENTLRADGALLPSPAGRGAGGEGSVQSSRYASAEPSPGPSGHPLPRGEGNIRCAFVSTNSITQGEQVGVLWAQMLRHGLRIHFAHRTFSWNNEARGVAAVHCVIVGFSAEDIRPKRLFDYETIKSDPHELTAGNINPYLVDAADVLLPNRSKPICDVPEIGIGNKPIDGGNYLFSTDERDAFIAAEPDAAPWFRRWLGSDEFINGWERWCLWLGECPPDVLRRLPLAMQRVQAVRAFRLASKSAPTRKLADTATRFHVENFPHSTYLLIPRVSSERRAFIPVGFMDAATFSSDSALIVREATLYHFGILNSTMHMAWVRAVCGRLKSDYRYSAGIVYNNFPWPELPLEPLSPRGGALLPSPSGRGAGGEGSALRNGGEGSALRNGGEGSALRNGGEGSALRNGGEGSALRNPPLPQAALTFARELRRHETDAEARLWYLLRARRLGGFKFRRQHSLPPYVLDFYCAEQCLAVELDGSQHVQTAARDRQRDEFLQAQGIRVLRFWNDAVFKETTHVLEAIWLALNEDAGESEPSPPTPLPEGEGSNALRSHSPSPSGRGWPEGSGEGSGVAIDKHRTAIEAAAQGVLDARAKFPDSTLADLYDPLTMPPALVKAHQVLDRAVDAAYLAAEKTAGRKAPKLGSDAERVAFLFQRYQALTSLLPAVSAKTPRKPPKSNVAPP